MMEVVPDHRLVIACSGFAKTFLMIYELALT